MTDTILNAADAVVEPTQVDNSQVKEIATPEVSNVAPEPVNILTPEAPVESKEVEQTPELKNDSPSSLLGKEFNKIEADKDYWKDDWKEKMAGGDEKLTKLLDKYKNPSEAIKAYKELQTQFSKTRPIPELAKDATESQIKDYREQTGIPDSWDKYDTELEGISIGDFDKPVVDEFLKAAHDKNMRPQDVKNTLQTYFEVQEKLLGEQSKVAETQTAEVKQSLKNEWGGNYDRNIEKISSYISETMGRDVADQINSAVLQDGTYLINNPKILNHFLEGATASQGKDGTITSSQGQDYVSITARKSQLEKIANTKGSNWYNMADERRELAEINYTLANKK